MKTRILVTFLLVVLVIPFSQASAVTMNVTSNPLWTDTGVIVIASDTLNFSNAVASWVWGASIPLFGPAGNTQPSLASDEWITNSQHGELIGFIGNAALNLNALPPRAIPQNDSGLFVIDTTPPGGINVTGRTGKLWLGFNDDYSSNNINDNTGTGSVNVARVPEPVTILLLGAGLVGIAVLGRRKFKKNN